MKKIITAAAIAAIMGSSAAIADWDMPFFGDDNNSYNDSRWNNDSYGYGDGRGEGRGRGRGKGRGSFNFSMDADADADTEFDGDTNNSYYGRGYNNWDNRYNSRNGYGYAPYGYAPVAAPVAPVAPQAPIAPEAAK
ncbi:hypothetical protein JV46_04050 [Solemya velum gill symbiont]|uniref:Sulfur globule protein CV1 n=4 Tax=Solemya velum gill symbiont TaxID=2340 RepID=A0A0B0H8E6_SOVGS|nr:sulfur globule family protein [Solemya velum gill symbiont]KHF24650.1 hypothetical protein JV46_06840 [Solemya velum gill symbiont]KHF24907.1 hypothetical protein JV46_04050 [Solemya velum gill symbiont]OOY37699.1 hypothetical protein BOV89_05575 [Solemya velum gill symbiont]